MQFLKSTLFLIISGLAAVTLVGCNTIHGMGEDLSAGGKAISKAAGGGKSSSNQKVHKDK